MWRIENGTLKKYFFFEKKRDPREKAPSESGFSTKREGVRREDTFFLFFFGSGESGISNQKSKKHYYAARGVWCSRCNHPKNREKEKEKNRMRQKKKIPKRLLHHQRCVV
jgi:hypothetical protein